MLINNLTKTHFVTYRLEVTFTWTCRAWVAALPTCKADLPEPASGRKPFPSIPGTNAGAALADLYAPAAVPEPDQ